MLDYIPIHHVMHVEYGNKTLLLLLSLDRSNMLLNVDIIQDLRDS